MNTLLSFFNTDYPCDHWFQTHISDVRYRKDDVCKCIFKEDFSRDITFTIKNVVQNGNCAEIELRTWDFDDDNFYDILKDYRDCTTYKLFWIDNKSVRHEYSVISSNTEGNNNGMYLKEI